MKRLKKTLDSEKRDRDVETKGIRKKEIKKQKIQSIEREESQHAKRINGEKERNN